MSVVVMIYIFIGMINLSAAYLTLEWFKPLIEKGENYKKLYEKLEPLAEATSCWDILLGKI